jgi:hypothetical protein
VDTKLRRANAVVEELKGLYAEGNDAALSAALKLLDETVGTQVSYTDEEADVFRFAFRRMIRSQPPTKKKKASAGRVPAYLIQVKKPATEQFYDWVNGGKILP